MTFNNFFFFSVKLFREGAESSVQFSFPIVLTKKYIFLPCFFYFLFVFLCGNSLGSGNGLILGSEERIYYHDKVVFTMFDVENSVIKRGNNFINYFVSFLSFSDGDGVFSVNYGGDNGHKQNSGHSKEIHVGTAECNTEESHDVFFYLMPWIIGFFYIFDCYFFGHTTPGMSGFEKRQLFKIHLNALVSHLSC